MKVAKVRKADFSRLIWEISPSKFQNSREHLFEFSGLLKNLLGTSQNSFPDYFSKKSRGIFRNAPR